MSDLCGSNVAALASSQPRVPNDRPVKRRRHLGHVRHRGGLYVLDGALSEVFENALETSVYLEQFLRVVYGESDLEQARSARKEDMVLLEEYIHRRNKAYELGTVLENEELVFNQAQHGPIICTPLTAGMVGRTTMNHCVAQEKKTASFISKVEDFALFIYSLSQCKSYSHFSVTVLQYVKTHINGSLLLHVEGLLRDHMDSFCASLCLSKQDSSESRGNFIQQFRTFVSAWKYQRDGETAEHFCNLVSLLTIANLMPLIVGEKGTGLNKESGEFWMNGFKLFSSKVMDIQKDAIDVFQMALETVLFFLERGFVAFSTGNPRALLYSDVELDKMDQEYTILISAKSLVESGKLSQLKAPYVPSIKDELDYTSRLDALIKKITDAASLSGLHPASKAALMKKLEELMKVSVSLIQAQQSKSIRVRPFALEFYGDSGVGKTLVNKAVLKAICYRNNFAHGERNFVTLNEDDEYESELRAGTVAVTIDDFANSKSSKTGKNPSKKIIDYVNNVTRNATKADLGSKGNVPVQPKLFSVTTNVKDLKAYDYSNEPVSVLRRFNFVVTVELRESHQDETCCFDPDAFVRDKDAWHITIQKVKKLRREPGQDFSPKDYITVKEKVSLTEASDFLCEQSVKHFADQDAFAERTEMEDECGACPHGRYAYTCLECANCEFDEQQAGPSQWVEAKSAYMRQQVHQLKKDDSYLMGALDRLCSFLMCVYCILCYYPLRMPRASDWVSVNWYGETLRSTAWSYTKSLCRKAWDSRLVSLVRPTDVGRRMRSLLYTRLYLFYFHCRYGFTEAVGNLRDIFVHAYVSSTLGSSWSHAFIAVGGMIAAWKVMRMLRDTENLDVDHSDEEVPIEDFSEQAGPTKSDYDMQKDVWKRVRTVKRDFDNRTVGMTFADFKTKMSKCLHLAHNINSGLSVNCFPLKGNYWLLPTHFIPTEEKYELVITRTSKNTLGHKVRAYIDSTMWRRVEGTDLTVVQIPSMGPQPDLLRLVSNSPQKDLGTCVHFTRTADYEFHEVGIASPTYREGVCTRGGYFNGYIYCREGGTEPGICMSPLVTKQKEPIILGFHLYGIEDDDIGAGFSGFVSRATLQETLFSFDIAFDVANAGRFPEESLGVAYGLEYPIHPRHAVNFQRTVDGEEPSAEIIGAHTGIRISGRSNIRETPIATSVMKAFGVENIHGPPQFNRARYHWQRDLEAMSHPSSCIEPELLNLALSDVNAKFDRVFSNHYEQIAPLDLEATTSGISGIRGIDRVDMSTSVGFPINKRKELFASFEPGDNVEERVVFDSRFTDMMDGMESTYARGDRAYPVFRACMKDEALPKSKDKIRVFSGCQLAYVLLVRKYFLPLTRMEHVLWEQLEGCVGINAHGPDWTTLAQKLQRFGSDKYIAGDYSKYDKRTNPFVTMAAMSVYIRQAERSGNYTARDLIVMRGIATDAAYPVYEYDGVFIELLSSWTSGIPITVDGNNIMNMLYLRYSYYGIALDSGMDVRDVPSFDERVNAVVYGDDNAMEVHEDAHWFNHTSLQDYLSSIGMTYTMPDKEAASVPFVSFEDCTFLKRSFLWNSDLGEYLAPLETASIMKSLFNYHHDKRTDTLPEEICQNAVDTALGEFFRHGEEKFIEARDCLQEVVSNHDFLRQGDLPSYEDMVNEYTRRYLVDSIPEDMSFSKDIVFNQAQSGPFQDDVCTAYEWGYEMEVLMVEGSFVPQAGETEEANTEIQENVEFVAQDPGFHVYNDDTEDTRDMVGNNNLSLQDFFSRAVRINVLTWNTGTLTTQISPWSLFLESPRVQNRINNFRTMSATMTVRFEVTGNPFQLGRMLVSYFPFSDPGLPASRPIIAEDAVQESQRLSLWLDPTNGTGGEMTLPFFIERDRIDVSEGDWTQFGLLTFRPVNALTNTNGSTDPATISTFAWLNDVSLDTPTTFNSAGLQPQAGENDEYSERDGVVSKPASSIASFAGKLTNIPVIGRYARATEMVSSGIASVAKMFGYCKASNIRDEELFNNRYFGRMAVTECADTCIKLSATAKQELTIDPRTMGVSPVDEMSIAHVVGIESYLTTFSFNGSQQIDELIFSMAISPGLYRTQSIGNGNFAYHMTPMCAVSQMFQFWRGTIKVRLMVVCSNFQRGKLRVVWEPGEASPTAPVDYNTVQSEVLDFAQCRDMTFHVGWGSPLAYLEVPQVQEGGLGTENFSTGPVVSPRARFNGNLSVYVVNPIVNSGDGDQPVPINVLVSGDDDFMFGSPSSRSLRDLTYLQPQAGRNTEYSAIEGRAHENTPDPAGDNCATTFGSSRVDERLNTVYMGETITSLRMLCKRSVHQRTEYLDGLGNGNIANYMLTRYPVLIALRGPDTIEPLDRDVNFSLTNTPFHLYIIPFYAGWRGSIRFRVGMSGDLTGLGADLAGLIGVTRITDFINRGQESVPIDATSSQTPEAHIAEQGAVAMRRTANGGEYQPTNAKHCVEAEVPYQRNFRFTKGRIRDMSDNAQMPAVEILAVGNANSTKTRAMEVFTSCGEDFTAAYFTGIPPMYFVISPGVP